MTAPSPPSIENLLAHRSWVRAVARSLVKDAARADDLEQEVWLAALRSPPEALRSPRAWLGTILRRHAARSHRTKSRTARREQIAARPEALPATADTVATAEAHENVVHAVLGLAEPYRSTLLLRFFEGLAPLEIAKRMAVEVSTVRGRQSRGLAMLRERLVDAGDGDERAWALTLLPLLDARTGSVTATTTATTGVLVMTTTQKTAVAMTVAGLLGLVLWISGAKTGSRDAAAAMTSLIQTTDTAAAPTERTRRVRTEERPGEAAQETDASTSPAPTPPSAMPEARRPRVTIRFVDSETAAALGADEVLAIYRARDRSPTALLAPESTEGEQLDETARRLAEMIRAPGEGWRVLEIVRRLGQDNGPTTLEVDAPSGAGLVVVDPWGVPRRAQNDDGALSVALRTSPATARLRLIDAGSGDVLTGAHVRALVEDFAGPEIAIDSTGHAELPIRSDLPASIRWWVHSETHSGRISLGAIDAATVGGTVDVRIRRSATITGHAYLPDGSPAAGRPVVVATSGRTFSSRTEDDGAFRIEGVAVSRDGPELTQMTLIRDVAALSLTTSAVLLRAGETTDKDLGEAEVTRARASLRGSLRLGGEPLAGGLVLLQSGLGKMAVAKTGADGTFVHEGLRPGEYTVLVVIGDTRRSPEPVLRGIEPIALAAGDERDLDFELPDGVVRVRVVDDTGAPVAGAEVRAMAGTVDEERYPGFVYSPGGGAPTSDDGTVVIGSLDPSRTHSIYVEAVEGAHQETIPGTRDAPAEITVTVPKR